MIVSSIAAPRSGISSASVGCQGQPEEEQERRLGIVSFRHADQHRDQEDDSNHSTATASTEGKSRLKRVYGFICFSLINRSLMPHAHTCIHSRSLKHRHRISGNDLVGFQGNTTFGFRPRFHWKPFKLPRRWLSSFLVKCFQASCWKSYKYTAGSLSRFLVFQ